MGKCQPFTRQEMAEQNDEYREKAQVIDGIMINNFSQISNYVNAPRAMGIDVLANTVNRSTGNIPAVIVGAGPSLDGHLDLLKSFLGDVLVIALDAALPSLDRRGIKPHVVVVTDHSTRQVANFKDIDVSDPLVCLSTYVHPLTFNEVRRSNGKVFWYHLYDPNSDVSFAIRTMGGVMHGSLYPGVLTSGSAFQVALWIGCRRVTFIGHDLSYPSEDHPGYASGVTEEKIKHQRMTKYHSLVPVSDINGDEVLTHETFVAFRNWMMTEDDDWGWPGVEVHNSTGVGILHSMITNDEGEVVDTGRILQTHFEEFLNRFSMPGCAQAAVQSMTREYLMRRESTWNIIPRILKNSASDEGRGRLAEEIIEYEM